MKIRNYLIILILVVGAFLRLYKLGSLPASLTPDEASLGYNAYSILKTGKDEYGKFLPIIFKSFGDYKPGFYVYTAVPFVAIFGLNEWTTRLPSAIAGTLIIYLVYLIVGKLKNKDSDIDLFAAFVAAVNPWLMHFSRGAWESNLSLMLVLVGIYLFLRSFENPKSILGSSVAFALTFVTYQGAKLSTTLVMLVLAIVFWQKCKELMKQTKLIWLSAFLGLIIVFPVLVSLFTGKTGRLAVFSVFSYPRPAEYTQAFLNEGGEKVGSLSYYLYHSEFLNLSRGVIGRWFNHFSGKFLFFEGDYQNPKHSAPNSGMMLVFDFVLIPFGFLYLIRSKKLSKNIKLFTFLWLVLSPLPAALSRDQVQAVRALNMAVPLNLISGFGLFYLFKLSNRLRPGLLRFSGISMLVITYVLALFYFWDSYFVHLNKHNAKYWSYGYRQLVQDVIAKRKDYKTILVQQSFDQPYIYFLFYGAEKDAVFAPSVYQKTANLVDGGLDVGHIEKIANIEFTDLSWPPPVNTNDKTLIAGNPIAIPDGFLDSEFNLIEEIKYPDNFTTAFRIIENN